MDSYRFDQLLILQFFSLYLFHPNAIGRVSFARGLASTLAFNFSLFNIDFGLARFQDSRFLNF